MLQFALIVFFADSLSTVAPADHWAQLIGVCAAVLLLIDFKLVAANWRPADCLVALGFLLWPMYQIIAIACWHAPWQLAASYWYYAVGLLLAQAMKLHRPKPELIFAGFALAALGANWSAMQQVVIEGLPRARGHWYMINFGDWSIVFGLSALLGCLLPSVSRLWRCLFVLGALAGLAASFLSGTRGAWFALPAYLFTFSSQWRLRRPSLLSLLSATVMGVCLISLTGGRIAERLTATSDDIAQLSRGETDTSIGMRLTMWRISLDIVAKHPVCGVGPAGFQAELVSRVLSAKLSDVYAQFQHAHNELLDALVSGGILKLGAVLSIYAIWLKRFKHACDPKLIPFQIGGRYLVFSVFIFGLSEALFRDDLTARLWPILLSVFWAMSQDSEHKASTSDLPNTAAT